MSQPAIQILQKADGDKLPSLPHVLLQLLDTCNEESLSFVELARLFKLDPGLYSRVYNACARKQCRDNSQSISDKKQNIEQALQDLGINAIKSIAVTAAVQQFFSRTSLERTAFLKTHWLHSIYCANVAQSIAKHCNYSNTDEAYATGLLHGIGKLAMASAYPELNEDKSETTHQQVGATLLKKHGHSHFIADAVLYQHESAEQILDAHSLVKIINLASRLTTSLFNDPDESIYADAELLLELDKALLLEILEKSQERTSNSANNLEIALPTDDAATRDVATGDEVTISADQQNSDDEYKQVQLAEQVRNIALLDGLHQHLSRSTLINENPQQLFSVLSQHIGSLFGVEQCLLFLYDAGRDRVQAIAAEHQPYQLAEISIPLTSGRSLVTDALLNKQARHTFHSDSSDDKTSSEHGAAKLSVIDRQLLGITQQQGFICLPMMMNNAAVGTLILGVDRNQFKNLWKQKPFLMRFSNEVAHTISANHIPEKVPAKNSSTQDLKQKIHEVLHEVRNPLSIMNNYLGILSYKLDNDKPAQEDVETIKSEIERISLILNRLLEEETTAEKISQVDINSIIADLTHVFQTSLFATKNIQISLDLDERINTLPSNANTLKQIYTNLIKNAVEALPANGKLMVYTQDYVNVDGVEHIEISVADDGPGIDTDILSRLFSPVESTKGSDHAGLGLTIVKNLVNDLHGSISCRSSDKGTNFHILLPKV